MQIKSEITLGHLISISTSLVMIGVVYGTTNSQLREHDRILAEHKESIKALQDYANKANEATAELSKSIAVLATVIADGKERSQTINVK